MSGFVKKTSSSASVHRTTQIVTSVSGVKRSAEPPASARASAPVDVRQAKFRKLIGDGESKDLDSYRSQLLSERTTSRVALLF